MKKHFPLCTNKAWSGQISTETTAAITQAACFLDSLYALISENIDSQLPVAFLAKKMTVSKSTLNRKLSKFTGLSVTEIVKQCRMQKAVELLASGKNVTETAYLTGFETPSYFIRCFREFYKQTPKKYAVVQPGIQSMKSDEVQNFFYQIKTA